MAQRSHEKNNTLYTLGLSRQRAAHALRSVGFYAVLHRSGTNVSESRPATADLSAKADAYAQADRYRSARLLEAHS